MSAAFITASTQFLSNAGPLLLPGGGVPVTLGGWFRSNTASASQACLGVYGTNNESMEIFFSSTNTIRCRSVDSANITVGTAALTTTIVLNSWYFVLARFLSSSNRRVTALSSTGFIESAQDVTAVTINAISTVQVGGTTLNAFWLNGNAAEIWYTNTDIWGDSVPDNTFIRQLAFGGPFSIPSVAKDILEYRSLRTGVSMEAGENYSRANSGVWTTSATAPLVGPHPPLPSSYQRPTEDIYQTLAV